LLPPKAEGKLRDILVDTYVSGLPTRSVFDSCIGVMEPTSTDQAKMEGDAQKNVERVSQELAALKKQQEQRKAHRESLGIGEMSDSDEEDMGGKRRRKTRRTRRGRRAHRTRRTRRRHSRRH